MEVEVVGRHEVSPPPGSVPPTSLPSTFFDIPWLLFPASQPLFFYDYPFPASHFLSTTLPHLIRSLSLTLQHFFALAGNLVCFPDSLTRPRIVYNEGDFVSLVIAESQADFFHLSANYQRSVDEFCSLLPQLPRRSSADTTFPLLAAQITVFSNVGICIGFSYHPVAADGRTFNNFIKTWASIFQSETESNLTFSFNSVLPFYDRTVIKDPCDLESVFLNHWRRSKMKRKSSNDDYLSEMVVRATFLMCPVEMEKIKQWIIGHCKLKNKPQPPRLSPYNLTCAFVWVCLVKAHEKVTAKLFGNNPSYFGFNGGGITRLDYPVPTNYFGNCIVFARSMAFQSELCGEDGIIVAAHAMGNRVKELDEGVLNGAENWISDWEVFFCSDSEPHVTVAGSPKLDFYETDFGWGRPKKIEEISIDNGNNIISFTQSRDVKGGIEVGLALPKPKMDAYTSFFTQGLKLFKS